MKREGKTGVCCSVLFSLLSTVHLGCNSTTTKCEPCADKCCAGGYTCFQGDCCRWISMDSKVIYSIHDVWGTSSSDVFAVGSGGVVLHYDGSEWSVVMESGTTATLEGVWGTSGDNVFAVGGYVEQKRTRSVILHYDGIAWSEMPFFSYNHLIGVWGSSDTNVFAVGYDLDLQNQILLGAIMHYDGNQWTVSEDNLPLYLFEDVWGTSENDVFAIGKYLTAGADPLILRYDGNTWTEVDLAFAVSLYGMHGLGADYAWAVGYSSDMGGGFAIQWDGIEWSEPIYVANPAQHDVWCASEDLTFFVGSESSIVARVGTESVQMKSDIVDDPLRNVGLYAVWGSSPGEVFTVGSHGTILNLSCE